MLKKIEQMDHSSVQTSIIDCQKAKGTGQDTSDHKMTVYIWDMDETLILLKSLLNGTFAISFNGSKDIDKGKEIGRNWEKYILQFSDEFFFYEQIENYNEPSLDILREYDDAKDLSDYDFKNDGLGTPCDDVNKRKLAYRHRIIAQKYAKGLHNFLDPEMITLWEQLYNLTDSYTDGWFSSARTLLQETSGRLGMSDPLISPTCGPNATDIKHQNVNILVTSGSLVPSLVKCLLFRLDDLIEAQNVYSSWEVGKLQCFSWVKQRFAGANVQFCVIGDGFEECKAAEAMGWPFIRIDPRPDGFHRFPGLTMQMVKRYMEVIYKSSATTGNDVEQ
ncbi:eyes absent homolog isoform X2 [Aristolochia californica]